MVNYEKSTIHFTTNTSKLMRESVVKALPMRQSLNPRKYLGLPNVVD